MPGCTILIEMRKSKIIGFSLTERERREIERALPKIPLAPGLYQAVELHLDSSGPEDLISALDRLQIPYIDRISVSFGREEILGAEFTCVVSEMKPEGQLLLRSGTTLNTSDACPFCLTGAIPADELIQDRNSVKTKGDSSQTYEGLILFSEKLIRRALLRDSPVLKPVVDSNNYALPWSYLHPQAVLPPALRSSRGVHRDLEHCLNCDRDGYFDSMDEPTQFAYPAAHLNAFKSFDVLATFECFGHSTVDIGDRVGYIPQPRLLISRTLTSQLLEFRVRGIRLVPVSFEA